MGLDVACSLNTFSMHFLPYSLHLDCTGFTGAPMGLDWILMHLVRNDLQRTNQHSLSHVMGLFRWVRLQEQEGLCDHLQADDVSGADKPERVHAVGHGSLR